MHPDSGLSTAVRLLLPAKAAVVVALVTHGQGMRPLDAALWAVLAALATLGLMALVPMLRRPLPPQRGSRLVVLPERSAATSAVPDPAVQARTVAVELARDAVLAARQRGADLDELLALAQVLHGTRLDLARATQSAGGWVDPALRHELALLDRGPESADVEQPAAQG